jgi:hypothetical protein
MVSTMRSSSSSPSALRALAPRPLVLVRGTVTLVVLEPKPAELSDDARHVRLRALAELCEPALVEDHPQPSSPLLPREFQERMVGRLPGSLVLVDLRPDLLEFDLRRLTRSFLPGLKHAKGRVPPMRSLAPEPRSVD